MEAIERDGLTVPPLMPSRLPGTVIQRVRTLRPLTLPQFSLCDLRALCGLPSSAPSSPHALAVGALMPRALALVVPQCHAYRKSRDIGATLSVSAGNSVMRLASTCTTNPFRSTRPRASTTLPWIAAAVSRS